MMTTINLEDFDGVIQEFLAMLSQKRTVVIYKDGKPCYFFGEIDHFQEEVLLLSQHEEFTKYLAQCRQRSKTEGRISLAEIEQKLADLEEENAAI